MQMKIIRQAHDETSFEVLKQKPAETQVNSSVKAKRLSN